MGSKRTVSPRRLASSVMRRMARSGSRRMKQPAPRQQSLLPIAAIAATPSTRLRLLAQRAGVPLVFVDPAYTSQTCAECGRVDKRDRVDVPGGGAGHRAGRPGQAAPAASEA